MKVSIVKILCGQTLRPASWCRVVRAAHDGCASGSGTVTAHAHQLMRLVPDESKGPLATGEDKNTSPVGAQHI